MKQLIVTPFVQHAKEENKLSITDPIVFLTDKLQKGLIFGQDHILRTGKYKEMGYLYNFRPFLKVYWVKFSDGHIQEFYCLNKTILRKLLPYDVIKIIEVTF